MSAEVRCEKHGTFVYKSAECPGCARERLTYRQRQDVERERLRALRQDEHVRGTLLALEQKHGFEHMLGSLGQTYHGVLLGAVDIVGKRYARLHRRPLGEVVCVPWIDGFAEWIGEKIVVEWQENESKADRFQVSEKHGAIEEPEEEKLETEKLTARELRATDAGEAGDALRLLRGVKHRV